MMRVTVPGFDYTKRPAEKLEIPLGQRLARMRSERNGGRRAAATGHAGQGARGAYRQRAAARY
jgi:hypothetical protein